MELEAGGGQVTLVPSLTIGGAFCQDDLELNQVLILSLMLTFV